MYGKEYPRQYSLDIAEAELRKNNENNNNEQRVIGEELAEVDSIKEDTKHTSWDGGETWSELIKATDHAIRN